MLFLLSLIPLLVAILAIAALRMESRLIKAIALLGSISPLLFVPMMVKGVGTTQNIDWFSVGGGQFTISATLLPINLLLFVLVSAIGPLVILYSMGFMDVMHENKRFYIEILAFEAAMLAFSIAGNFILLFIAWEFLSITSYLLIGFWYAKERASTAARKTITIILMGDIAMLAAMAILFASYSTLSFAAIISQVAAHGMNSATAAALTLVLFAAFTKSAQFPFQEWLTAAMEGPTPVSAFLHSSTMVKAGVFLVMILFPLFQLTRLMPVIVVFGGLTALIGISNALVGRHIKKVLAYSTIEELSLMFFALGIGAYAAAIYFFFAQTFYKALLFFYSGALMKANNTEDITQMGGVSRHRLLFISGLFGVLALAGFVPFDGFFANAFLESSATNLLSYGFMLMIDLLVSLFIARWFFIPLKKPKSDAIATKLDFAYGMLPKIMFVPIVILAIMTLAASYLFGYISSLSNSMATYGYGIASGTTISYLDMALESALVVFGVIVMYALFYRREYREDWKTLLGQHLLANGRVFETFYTYVSGFALHIAGAFEFFDSELNASFDEIGKGVAGFGNYVRELQTGAVNFYALAAVAGVAVIIILLVA
ncbi:MAG: NADH-quinone oxidoreductase subunit L [Candidatus Micrarchaeota archaeon]|nr:NADH-quinone oxidoreductase subunit L [Candidatus Micrarchaeota archaeon]